MHFILIKLSINTYNFYTNAEFYVTRHHFERDLNIVGVIRFPKQNKY